MEHTQEIKLTKAEKKLLYNKLIAEFMGETITDLIQDVWIKHECSPHSVKCDYHSSWDWLMPVVERIRGLHTDKKVKRADMSESADRIFCLHLIAARIDIVYNSVLAFITWYNNQKH